MIYICNLDCAINSNDYVKFNKNMRRRISIDVELKI
jgi:hypothetical protein